MTKIGLKSGKVFDVQESVDDIGLLLPITITSSLMVNLTKNSGGRIRINFSSIEYID